MDFSLTPDQQLPSDTGRKLLERECPPALVRAHIEDPSAYEPLWRHLSEYTALGAGPAAVGGPRTLIQLRSSLPVRCPDIGDVPPGGCG